MKRRAFTSMHWLLVAVAALSLAACASIGRPQGGERDVQPPVFIRSNPAPQSVKVTGNNIDIFFDENVQLQDAFSKVIVSPAQKNTPAVTSNGKRVSVELKDTLLPNTTYTIDFGDAIKDLNEGNILDGFTYAFSTGDSIDSLRISGIVLQASNLEPAQGMLVGAYSNLSDTAITTLPLERVARTNQLGQFTIYNLKPGQYRVFALNDVNRDYKWDRSEDVAFFDSLISPWTEPISVTDTLRGSDGKDSLSVRQGVAFFPNDVLLTWFNEDYKAQYLKDYKRPERKRITLNFAAPSDSLPEITIASGPLEGLNADSWALRAVNQKADSLEYWITDSAVLATDSLYLSVRYQRTDTTDMLAWRSDTLKFFFKDPVVKDKKKKNKKEEREEKEEKEEREESGDSISVPADSLPPQPKDFLVLSAVTSKNQEIHLPMMWKASLPIDTIDVSAAHLEIKNDTLWDVVTNFSMEIDSLAPLFRRNIVHKWKEGETYRFTLDSLAVISAYGLYNKPFVHEFTVKKEEDYANLVFNISGLDDRQAIVEVLSNQDAPIARAPVVDGRATLLHLNPGTVYARIFIDANGNGKWDTGALLDSIQPEEVAYYPKKINLKKNWDLAQDWDIYALAIDVQKPLEIKKNKPKTKPGEGKNTQEDEEEEDDYDNYGIGSYGTSGGGFGRQPVNNNNGYRR